MNWTDLMTNPTAQQLAERFHETYERLAPEFGYETRPDTRTFDPSTQNGRLMVAVCAELLAAQAEPLTDKKIAEIAEQVPRADLPRVPGYKLRAFARAIERAHGITAE